MQSTEDVVQIGPRIPVRLKALIDADERTQSEIVASGLWREFGGAPKPALERRKAEIDNRIAELEEQIQRRKEEIEDLRTERAAVEQRLEEEDTVNDEYQQLLEELDDLLEQGSRVFVGHAKVERAAQLADTSQEAVLDELRDRNPDIPEEQFEPANGGVVR